MKTGRYLVEYRGIDNNDYDGEQIVERVISASDAEACVFEMLEAQDRDATEYVITAREITE